MKKSVRAATKNTKEAAAPTPILAYAPPERLCECLVGIGGGIEVAVVKLDIEDDNFVLLIEATLVSIESRLPEP
jgi:hypothetical protein